MENQKAPSKNQKKKAERKVAKSMLATIEKIAQKLPSETCDNPYLACLLNPAQFSYRYPDKFGGKTALLHQRITRELVLDANKQFWAWVRPLLRKQLLTQDASTTLPLSYSMSFFGGSSNLLTAGGPSSAQPVDSTNRLINPSFMTALTTLNGKSTIITKSVTTLAGTVIYAAYDISGISAPASISVYGGGTYLFAATRYDLHVDMVDSTGVTQQINPTIVTHPTAGSTWVYFTYRWDGTHTGSVDFINILLNTGASAQATAEEVDVPDADVLDGGTSANEPLVESYRVVAQSVLVTFEGDTLSDGGKIAGLYHRGNSDPQAEGLVGSYTNIASLDEAYDGRLSTGLYMVWRPTSDGDMDFRNPGGSDADGFPTLLIAGSSTQSSTVIRLRIDTILECETSSLLLEKAYSPISLAMCESASRVLSTFPYGMENPIHLETIRKFIREAIEKGGAMYKKVEPFIPVIKAAATAAGFLV